MDISTLLAQPSPSDQEPTGASSTPLYQSATFAVDEDSKWDYSRSGNPTRSVLESQLALLDGAEEALAFSSGVAAIAAVLRLVPCGGRIACAQDVYGGTFRLLQLLGQEHAWAIRFFDLHDPDLERHLAEYSPDLFLAEVPSNPLLIAADLSRIRAQLPSKTLLAVDHSMVTGLRLRPLDEGADVAIQSATKFLGGHGDLTGGVVSTNSEGLAATLRFRQNAEGTALAPFPSWLLLRGLQTLPVRLQRSLDTTREIRDLLVQHRGVERVFYPRRSEQECTVLSFATGSVARSRAILRNTRLFRTTVSFGSVFSSISMPVEMSHASVPVEYKETCAIPADLIRISIGLEDREDLWGDLREALDAVGDQVHLPLEVCL